MPRPEHERCPRCQLHREWCLCDLVPSVETDPRFVIVRHHKEQWHPTNTARIAALALRRCDLVDYGVRGEPLDPSPLLRAGTWLLFPPEPPRGAPTGTLPPGADPPREPPDTVVVLDGSWSQARSMSHRIPAVAALPRFVVPGPPRDVPRLRRPPAPWAVSTIEAIARTLEFYGERGAADALDDLHAEFVRRTLLQRGVRPEAGQN